MNQTAHMESMKNIKLVVDTQCTICFNIIMKPVQLECQHAFCQRCLEASLKYRNECPICRIVPSGNFKSVVNNELARDIRERSDSEEYLRLKEQLFGPKPENIDYHVEFPPEPRADDYKIKIKYGNTFKPLHQYRLDKNSN